MMPNQLTCDCYYSPTGKAYQSTNGSCSCVPVTPGLNDEQRGVWLALYNAGFKLVVQGALMSCNELVHLADQISTLRNIVFEWDGTTLTTREVPPHSFDVLRTIASRLDGIDKVMKNSHGELTEVAESLDDLSCRIFKVYP